jgi:hypothetical protein
MPIMALKGKPIASAINRQTKSPTYDELVRMVAINVNYDSDGYPIEDGSQIISLLIMQGYRKQGTGTLP